MQEIECNLIRNFFLLSVVFFFSTLTALADPVEHIEQAGRSGSQASANTSASVGHSIAASGQLTSGVIAMPLLASGVVALGAGSAALQAGDSMMDARDRPAGKALPITEETISIVAPDQALQKKRTAP